MMHVDSRDGKRCGGPDIAARGEKHLRCNCGSLLARLVPAGVELKCRRCKRVWVVPLHKGG